MSCARLQGGKLERREFIGCSSELLKLMAIIYSMNQGRTLLDKYLRWRSTYWHFKRLVFMSPAEVRFMRLLGARVVTLPWLKSGFPCSIVMYRGKVLRQAGMRRDVRFGRYYVDFANDLNWVIEIDGTHWHMDVVADMDREIYIKELLKKSPYDWRLLRIPAPRLWHDQAGVKAQVLKFLS